MQPGWRHGVALLHRGYGCPHTDVLIVGGRRCLTLALADARWWPQAAHRRHYLTYRGPVARDRGTLTRVWQGRISLIRHALGRELRLPGEGRGLILRRNGVVIVPAAPHSRAWHWMTPGSRRRPPQPPKRVNCSVAGGCMPPLLKRR